MLAGYFLSIVLLATPTADASSGYKGVAWGTACATARDALARQGVKFRDMTPEPQTDAVRLDPAYAFAPSCANRSSHFRSYTRYSGDGPDFLDVSVLCRDNKFVAIWMSGLAAYSGAIDQVRGKPVQKKAGKDSLGNKSRFERLADRSDSVRFFHESWNRVSEHYVSYLVMAKTEYPSLLASQRLCAETPKASKSKKADPVRPHALVE
jgi:hypothetical protein